MALRSSRPGILLAILLLMASGACRSEKDRTASGAPSAMTGEEAAAAESGEVETYGAVDESDKPVTSGHEWDVTKIENDLSATMMAQVFLKNGIKIEPFAYQVKLVGMTETDESAPPVLLFSGKECTDCADNKNLYVHSVPDKSTTRLEYPGDYHTPEGGAPVNRVRFYFGNCLSEQERHLIHHLEKQVGGRGFERVVRTFVIRADGKVEAQGSKDTFAEESDVKARVAQRICQEIKPEKLRFQ